MRLRLARSIVATGLALLLAVQALAAERRIALVIGVSAYRAVPTLHNTLNDANGVGGALKRLGFDVDLVTDPDRMALESAVRRIGDRARGADVALFFYAGHAVEANGQNWLLPVSADIRDGRDLRFEGLDLDALLGQLDGAARLSVIILDSCRDNPFRMRLGEAGRGLDRGGLAQVSAAAGTLVVFSTAPGTVAGDGAGPNSPFTTALLKHMEAPGQEIRQMLADVRKDVREATGGKQVPWEQSAMEGTLYLNPTQAVMRAPVPGAAPPAAPKPALEADSLFWDSVRNSANAGDIKAYLDKFPQGTFADLARSRLAGLSAPSPVETVAARIIAARPVPGVAKLTQAARSYAAAHSHKAFAVIPEQDYLLWSGDWGRADRAEQLTLERCQFLFGEPCRLFALDDQIMTGDLPRRDMPRLHHAGPFNANEVPMLGDQARAMPAVAGYAAAPSPKALAVNIGFGFAVTGAASQHAAEEQALAQCNAAPIRREVISPCMIYAAGNQVVIGQRRTQPAP